MLVWCASYISEIPQESTWEMKDLKRFLKRSAELEVNVREHWLWHLTIRNRHDYIVRENEKLIKHLLFLLFLLFCFVWQTVSCLGCMKYSALINKLYATSLPYFYCPDAYRLLGMMCNYILFQLIKMWNLGKWKET